MFDQHSCRPDILFMSSHIKKTNLQVVLLEVIKVKMFLNCIKKVFTFAVYHITFTIFLISHQIWSHNLQKVWTPPLYRQLPCKTISPIFFPILRRFLDNIAPVIFEVKHKNKLKKESYFFIFWRLKNNTFFFYKHHFYMLQQPETCLVF